MASSLAEDCTPAKQAYDSCFNAWFEGYLAPAVAAPPAERAAHTKAKADEYEQRCGALWRQYKTCVDVCI
jgi:TRIAP1/MDM35 family protein